LKKLFFFFWRKIRVWPLFIYWYQFLGKIKFTGLTYEKPARRIFYLKKRTQEVWAHIEKKNEYFEENKREKQKCNPNANELHQAIKPSSSLGHWKFESTVLSTTQLNNDIRRISFIRFVTRCEILLRLDSSCVWIVSIENLYIVHVSIEQYRIFTLIE
jgi:hypothetical protein